MPGEQNGVAAPTAQALNVPADTTLDTFDVSSVVPESMRKAVEKADAPPAPEQKATEQQIADPANPDGTPDPIADAVKIAEQYVKKDGQVEEVEAPPFWKEHEVYKQIVDKLKYAGVPPTQIDMLITEVSDQKTIENGKYVTGLEDKIKTFEKDQDDFRNEVMRLKEIEREAVFETLPETAKKFIEPMTEAANSIRHILQTEGANMTVSQVLNSKNRTELTNLLKNFDFTDDQLTSLVGQWRGYKDSQGSYDEARKQARVNLATKLAHNITPEKASNTVRDALIDLMGNNVEFKYMREAIDAGLDKHKDVGEVIGKAQVQFNSMARALSNPHDFVKDPNWLRQLAKHTIENAHNERKAVQVTQLQVENAKKTQEVEALSKALLQLSEAAKGSVKSGASQAFSGQHGGGNGSQKSDEKADLAGNFKKFLSGEVSVEDLIQQIR